MHKSRVVYADCEDICFSQMIQVGEVPGIGNQDRWSNHSASAILYRYEALGITITVTLNENNTLYEIIFL